MAVMVRVLATGEIGAVVGPVAPSGRTLIQMAGSGLLRVCQVTELGPVAADTPQEADTPTDTQSPVWRPGAGLPRLREALGLPALAQDPALDAELDRRLTAAADQAARVYGDPPEGGTRDGRAHPA